MKKEDEAKDGKDESEETLSPEDLMAFAWQISQGMVRHFEVIFLKLTKLVINNFTVLCSVTWPLSGSEAGGDLVLMQASQLLLCKSSCFNAN